MGKFEELVAEVQAKYPKYRIVSRSSSVLTSWWGKGFATTIGNVTYAQPGFESWADEDKWAMIRHEATHTDDVHTWPLGPRVPWLNYVLFAACYFFVLPVVWTMRSRFEQNGYAETFIALAALGRMSTPAEVEAQAQWVAAEFYGAGYWKMWLKAPALAWARRVAADAAAGRLQSRWRS